MGALIVIGVILWAIGGIIYLFLKGIVYVCKHAMQDSSSTDFSSFNNNINKKSFNNKSNFCSKCGTSIEAGQLFCPMCGNRLIKSETPALTIPDRNCLHDQNYTDNDISEENDNDSSVSVSYQCFSRYVHHDYYRYFQRWDESYNKELGYEWFKICVEYVNYPIYRSIGARLYNIRKVINITQAEAARNAGISVSALSSYENNNKTPPNSTYESLADVYCVPVNFIKYGYIDDFIEHVNLCMRFGEDNYMDSLRVSIRSASHMFPEMLSQEDKEVCILINDMLKLNLDLFDEQAKADEIIYNEIKAYIFDKLDSQELYQKDVYKAYNENAPIVANVIRELYNGGIITKEKKGSTFILHLVNSTGVKDDEDVMV